MKPPILRRKYLNAPSVFLPENLMREARRHRDRSSARLPTFCVLDPDGDIVRHLIAEGLATRNDGWACYHTEFHNFQLEDTVAGIVDCAVGAPFAVLVSEQMFAAGCEFLVSVTSAGQLKPVRSTPYFVLIDRALRDEGTSYHYLPASEFSEGDPALIQSLRAALEERQFSLVCGPSWTIDAPYRETAEAIREHTSDGLLAVEMEAAALYAFARARRKPLVCFAHVTNTMAQTEGDFEKGESHGARDALALLAAVYQWWKPDRNANS